MLTRKRITKFIHILSQDPNLLTMLSDRNGSFPGDLKFLTQNYQELNLSREDLECFFNGLFDADYYVFNIYEDLKSKMFDALGSFFNKSKNSKDEYFLVRQKFLQDHKFLDLLEAKFPHLK